MRPTISDAPQVGVSKLTVETATAQARRGWFAA
jgi:hypothetical protein